MSVIDRRRDFNRQVLDEAVKRLTSQHKSSLDAHIKKVTKERTIELSALTDGSTPITNEYSSDIFLSFDGNMYIEKNGIVYILKNTKPKEE